MSEHLGILALTHKKAKPGPQVSTVLDHSSFCNTSPSFDNFSILTSEHNDFELTVIKSLLINRDKLILKRTVNPYALELF